MAADERSARQRPVADLRTWVRRRCFGREINREAAIGPVDAHRVKDLSRVDADSGAGPGEAGPVHGKMQACEQPRVYSYVRSGPPESGSTFSLVMFAPTEASFPGMFS